MKADATFAGGLIVQKVFSVPHMTLKGNAAWALGIVTGNNKKFLVEKIQANYEPVIKGKDVYKYGFKTGNSFINFEAHNFQQVAPVDRYRASEKLVYKFISTELVFAYDDRQLLTLNSANILIPKLPNYPIKVVLAFLNSSTLQFVFQKKFASRKVLKGHIEQLPLPNLSKETMEDILTKVDRLLSNQVRSTEMNQTYNELDELIAGIFLLSLKEYSYIKTTVSCNREVQF